MVACFQFIFYDWIIDNVNYYFDLLVLSIIIMSASIFWKYFFSFSLLAFSWFLTDSELFELSDDLGSVDKLLITYKGNNIITFFALLLSLLMSFYISISIIFAHLLIISTTKKLVALIFIIHFKTDLWNLFLNKQIISI